VLSLEDWAEIRRLSTAEGLSINEIVRRLGMGRNAGGTALRSDQPPAIEERLRARSSMLLSVVIGNSPRTSQGVKFNRRRQ
jgi:hypothetical protein